MIKPKESVENLEGYYTPLFENMPEFKLDSNENNYGPSDNVFYVLKNTGRKDICFYPLYGELTKKIAHYTGLNIENVKVTNGADEALQAIIQTYLNPGEALLTINPSFSMPEIYAQIQGGKVIKVDYEERWLFPLNAFVEALKRDEVKIVYIASPNNPTGNVITFEDLKTILDAAKDKVVIIDETYANYSGVFFDEEVLNYDNLFVTRSFSKDFALAGLRIGYILSCEENINNIKKVVSPYSVNGLAAKAAIAALSDLDYFERIKKEISGSRYELSILFKNCGAEVYESRANFVLADFGEKVDYVYNALIKNGIKVKRFGSEGVLGKCLRITVPARKGMRAVSDALKLKTSLVFDMDGVLIDAAKSYRIAIRNVYEKFTGKTLADDEIRTLKNNGGMNNDWVLTHYLLKREGVDIPYEKVVEVFDEFYWGKDCDGLVNNEEFLFDVELLKHLSRNYELGIFTGRTKKEAEYALNRFGVKDLFSYVITSDDVPSDREKPCPDGLNIIADRLPAKMRIYFGDTIDDMKCAVSAKYKAVGVLPPQDKSSELRNLLFDNGASAVLNNINDVITILENQ